ncbi:MAG: DUF418 domain-containing protein [Bacillota bacterium]|nr:DUF418 domain-containing protein [Bacillota bacterium]
MNENLIAPTQPGERINEIDIVRGLALLGILMVNMLFFNYPVFFDRSPTSFPAGLDQVGAWFIQLIFTGKFYAIFSFLFGLGFFIFMERTLQKGLDLVPLYRRRLFALLAFGFIHLFIIWSGDILFTYAIIGFILLKFRDKPVPSVRKWIIGLFITATILNFIFGLINGAGEYFSGEKYLLIMQEMIEGAISVYLHGSFLQLLSFRLINEVPYALIGLIIWIPAVLAFFLCGLYAGKKGIFKNIPGHLPLLRKIRNIGLPLGGLFLLIYILVESGFWPVSTLLRPALLSASNYIASIFIFPAYVSIVLIALQKDFWKRLLSPVSAAGRMALTNYLTQTLICIFLFYGFGFGFYAGVSVGQGIVLTLIIYLVQLFWSNLWFKKFRYGPMEWFWRMLTYRKKEKFLI